MNEQLMLESWKAVFEARFKDSEELVEFHLSRVHLYCCHVFDTNDEPAHMLICGRGKNHDGWHEDLEGYATWDSDPVEDLTGTYE